MVKHNNVLLDKLCPFSSDQCSIRHLVRQEHQGAHFLECSCVWVCLWLLHLWFRCLSLWLGVLLRNAWHCDRRWYSQWNLILLPSSRSRDLGNSFHRCVHVHAW